MKLRLSLFAVGMLLLPLCGLWLSGYSWAMLGSNQLPAQSGNDYATPLTAVCLLLYLLSCNWLVTKRGGHNLFAEQRKYFFSLAIVSMLTGWMLFYLNYFVGSWSASAINSLPQLLSLSCLFALLLPGVISTRALIGSFTPLLRLLSKGIPLPAPAAQAQAMLLLTLSLFGLLGGAAWPEQLSALFWAAPLLLLICLQLLWHESTILGGLKQGDYGRLICAALAGMLVGNLCLQSYLLNDAALVIEFSSPWLAQAGFAWFGLLSIQLADLLAEHWRGKLRGEVFKRKPFPIPVVVKK